MLKNIKTSDNQSIKYLKYQHQEWKEAITANSIDSERILRHCENFISTHFTA